MIDAIPKYSSVLRSTPPELATSVTGAWPTLADLRGAALPCLLLMAAFPQAVKSEWLSQASGYGRDSVLQGLNCLAGYGLASYDRAGRAWVLTEIGARFSLQLAGLFKLGFVPSSAVDNHSNDGPENQGDVDNARHERPEIQGAVENDFPSRRDFQGAGDNFSDGCPENQGDVEKILQNRPENQGGRRALSLKEDREEENINKKIKESSSGLTSRLTSPVPNAPPEPDGETQNGETGLVARLLQHSASLFGEPLLGSPADYPDLRRLLAVICEVYHNRDRLRKPARVAYINYRQGLHPDRKYWDATNRYLPEKFHRQIGLPYRSRYQDWSTPVDVPRYEPWTRAGDG